MVIEELHRLSLHARPGLMVVGDVVWYTARCRARLMMIDEMTGYEHARKRGAEGAALPVAKPVADRLGADGSRNEDLRLPPIR